MKKPIYLTIVMFSVINLIMAQDVVLKPVTDPPVYFDVSPPLRDMLTITPRKYDGSWKVSEVKNYFNLNINEKKGKQKMAGKSRFTAEEKVKILREFLENGVSISQLSEKHGIHPNLIYKWKNDYCSFSISQA